MSISKEDVAYTANLAKLHYEGEAVDTIIQGMSQIIKYVDVLSEVDTESVEPMTHVIEDSNVFRADVAGETLDIKAALLNAPETEGRAFLVPKVI